MKHLFTAIIAAAFVSLVPCRANAAWDIFGKHNDNDMTFKLFTQGEERVTTSAKDLVGHYLFSYHRAPIYSTGQFAANSCDVREGEKENEIILSFKMHSPVINLKGYVNFDTKEVTLYPQKGTVEKISEDSSITGFQMTTGRSSDRMWTDGLKETDCITAKIDEAGSIVFPPESYMKIYTTCVDPDNAGEEKSDLLEYADELRFTRKEFFKFEEKDWDSVGTATVTDESFISKYAGQSPYKFDVALYRDKRNENRYLLKSPYRTFDGGAASMFEGGIIYYTYYPDFIFTDIMTPLGINIADDGAAELDNEIFAVNNETRYIFSYYADREEILKEAANGSFELSSLRGSTLRLVVSGENIRNPFGTFPYGDMPPRIPMGAIDIALPANGIPAGVTLTETEKDVPVKYYNLMGTEVKNPEPGNILIKVRGNERKKIITE